MAGNNLTREQAIARLVAKPEADACILRIEDADYGCEECRDLPLVWVQVLHREKGLLSMEVPQAALTGMTVGSTCRMCDLRGTQSAD